MKEVLIKEYTDLKQLNIPYKKKENTFSVSFIQGARCEINGDEQKRYIVKFIDQKNNKVKKFLRLMIMHNP